MAARRIISGGSTVATAGAWPWAVVVIVNTSSGQAMCSGVLIGPATALTAAHCADPNLVGQSPSFTVSNARNVNNVSNSNSSSATSALDPSWNSSNVLNGHDFAVLTLASPLHGASYLPVLQPDQVSPFQTSLSGLVAGYGLTSANNPNSSGVLNQTEVQGASYPSNAAVITDGANPGYTCEGDSGAPLIVSQTGSALPVTSDPMPSNGHWAVIGVVSFGSQGCNGPEEGYAAAAAGSSFLLQYEIPVDYVTPAVTGTPMVGKNLSCSNGAWSTTVTTTYQWDTVVTGGAGTPIPGASGQTFTPGAAQVGKPLECIVTASAQGFGAPNHAASSPTRAVARATPILSATAPSKGLAGHRISASLLSAVLARGSAPTGKITFIVFGPRATAPPSCSSGGTVIGSATVSGNRTYHPSAGFTPTKAGNYWWYARYLGDAANTVASSRCGTSMANTTVGR